MKFRTYGVSRCDFTTAKPCIFLCGKRIGAAAEGWSGLETATQRSEAADSR
ncbi:MAG: hypothetical protein IPQ18_13830 [Saprospiraceae bacterium]|nr:hypothetical protein [Saprospiraceae bacterium]